MTKGLSGLSSPTTLNHHLGKMYEGRWLTASKRRKRSYSEMDNNDNNTDNTDDTVNTKNNSNNDNSLSIDLKKCQMWVPHLNINECDSSSSSTAQPSLCANDRSILMASDAINISETDKEKALMLSKIGNWKPIIILSENGENHHVLSSQTTIGHILTDQPTGVWALPT